MADDINRKGTENRVEGAADELKGKARNTFGAATGDTSEQVKGKAEELKGKVKGNIGKAEQDIDPETY